MKIVMTRRRMILLGLTLVVVVGLALVMRDFIRQTILLPLINLGWLVWVGLMSVPQAVFWALFLLIAIIIVLRSLNMGQPRVPGYAGMMSIRITQSSRYHYWKLVMGTMPHSPFARERIERELQTLVLQVLAEQERTDFEEIRARQLRGELDLSGQDPAIQALFNLKHNFYFAPPSMLRTWWNRLLGRPRSGSQDVEPLNMSAIIHWLEEQTGATLM
jgi:hypothetical protein